MIQFFNTLSGKLKEFKSLKDDEVSIYTCGPTVYDYAHIGNCRAFVFEDLLRRFLEFKGYKVKHVMNITDVDDKTIAGANHEGKNLNEYTRKYIDAFMEDLKTLNIFQKDDPSYELEMPRATDQLKEDDPKGIIALIKKLIEKEHAYVSDGSVYYRIASFSDYGNLCGEKKLKGNIEGARVDMDEYDKEEGADFALWKKAKEGEPSWDSPWGKGRPGWHIECSAMSMKYLGETFDIHAGGEDLIFPHHENEIAQSEAATGKKFVNYWLHCKHLLVDGKKMSKKEKNYYTLRDLLAKGYDPMAIRYVLLSVHYRQQLNFTFEGLREAEGTLERLRNCYFHCFNLKNFGINLKISLEEQKNWHFDLPSFEKYIKEGMDSILGGAYYPVGLSDDLNISYALSSLHEMVKHINFGLGKNFLDLPHIEIVIDTFKKIDQLLGLSITEQEVPPPEVLELQERRDTFRRNSEFMKNPEFRKQSDEIRTKIQRLGWDVKDGRPGEPSIIRKKLRPQTSTAGPGEP